MNVISLVTDPKNLFDYETGIYVTGAAFDEYMDGFRASGLDEPVKKWKKWTSNYSVRGSATEKPADIQFFDSEGNLVLSQRCGIRIHGNISRSFVPKSLNLYARAEYGNDYFRYPFFCDFSKNETEDDYYYPSRMTLFAGSSDYAECKDWIVNTLCRDMEFATMKMKPCVMFLDGEYWGVYWLTEKYDETYVNTYYGIERDNVVIIKNRQTECGTEQDYEDFFKDLVFLSNEDLTDAENFRKATSILDLDNTIDYYAVMLYISRYRDWSVLNNVALFRSRSPDVDRYSDCRYRWMILDLNSPGMVTDLDSIEKAQENDPLFANLMKNDWFRNQLLDRMLELGKTVFSEENVSCCLEKFHTLMDVPMRYHCKRFYDDDYNTKYIKRVKKVELFFQTRYQYIVEMAEKYRQLS